MNLYNLQETHLALCDSCSSSRSPMWVHFKWVGDISLIHVNMSIHIKFILLSNTLSYIRKKNTCMFVMNVTGIAA